MRPQSLVVPVVFLLIAVATLPGLSFSLSSSVTSNFNTISELDESGFGLYQDVMCDHPWSGPAFGKGVVEIVKDNGKKVIQKDMDVDLSGGGTSVYLLIPEGSGISEIKFDLTYHDNGAVLSEGCYIKFTLKETSDGTPVGSYVEYLDGTSSSTSIPVTDDHKYLVEAELHVPESEVIIGSGLPYFDITFESEFESFVNEGNEIDFRYNIDDTIEIESKGFQVQQSTSPISIPNGTAYEVCKSDGHFSTSNKGTTAVIDVGMGSDHGYYIQLDLGSPNGNNVNTITVTVKTTAGVLLFGERTFSSNGGRYVIIGADGDVQGTDNISNGGINPFTSAELEITVTGVTWNKGNTYIDLYLVKVPVTEAT